MGVYVSNRNIDPNLSSVVTYYERLAVQLWAIVESINRSEKGVCQRPAYTYRYHVFIPR